MKQDTVYARGLRYKLRMMGLTLLISMVTISLYWPIPLPLRFNLIISKN